MSAVPTVVRWWGNHSDPERLELYTRWSFYGAIGLTPLLAVLGLGSSASTQAPVLLGLVVVGAGAVVVLGVLLVRAGTSADPRGRILPRRLLAVGWGTGLVTATAGVLAVLRASEDAVAWSVTWPLGTLLVACSTVWPTRQLVEVGAGV